MDALDLILPLLTNLEVGEEFELSRSMMQTPVNVWIDRPSNGKPPVDKFGRVSLSIVNSFPYIAQLDTQAVPYVTFGDFYRDIENVGVDARRVLMVAESEPHMPNVTLHEVRFQDVLVLCGSKDLGLGVLQDNQYVFATAEFVSPLVQAISHDVAKDAYQRFYTEGMPFNFSFEYETLIQNLLDEESPVLLSFDTGGVNVGGEYMAVFVLNFTPDATKDEIDRVQGEMARILEHYSEINVLLYCVGEQSLGTSRVKRMQPKPFDHDFSSLFR